MTVCFQNSLIATPHHRMVAAASEALASQTSSEARGAIFTRPEVVEFILDLVGYTEDKPLFKRKILEPSFGGGDFLFPIIRRLIRSWRKLDPEESDAPFLSMAICGVELHKNTYRATRQAVVRLLLELGFDPNTADSLGDSWLRRDDFLLTPPNGSFDFIEGNPPYVRQELIPTPLLKEYRARYRTMYDRADIYIPFIEGSLSLLSTKGQLGFICSDRWMKNRYGEPLRKLISDKFHLKIYVDMVDTPAFHSDVITYPAITIINRDKDGTTRIARQPTIDRSALQALANNLCSTRNAISEATIHEIPGMTHGGDPWLLEPQANMMLLRRLERQYPLMEDAGCKVGIGVATGADKAFIGPFDSLDVEADRKLPLVTTKDIASGTVLWGGLGVINPFAEDGTLVDLQDYPRLRVYLEERKDIISKRHCAQRDISKWYRTIDRITPALRIKKKLLFPDIKGEANIVLEDGSLYPHHNLYYITTDQWSLLALQAVLLSNIAHLFISAYSTKMRGGYLRFQAQYVRRIPVPFWHDVPDKTKTALVDAAATKNIRACNDAVCCLYDLNSTEILSLEGGRS